MSVRTAVPLIMLVVGAAACGSSSSASTAPAASPSPAAPASRTAPGTSGKLASVAGTTLEVQGTDGQTTVTYSGTTTFTQTGAATKSDLAVGDCVQASATGTGSTAAASGPFTAARVVIESTSGTCAGGFGGGAGFGNRTGAPRPSGSPRPRRSFGAGGFGARAVGSVTSVGGDTFVVKGVARNGGTAASTTVTVTGSTTYTKTIKTAADALVVGKCVTALGKADSTGAVAATSIAVRDATNGTCTTGFGGRGFGGAHG